MTKVLSIIILVLAIVLFPPAALAVVSNNAIPGDSTYPIKRGLEDVIYAIASLNPNTKALFAKARSDRRFQEITLLLTQGKKVSKTLNELVEQTQVAADQINQVSDPNQKGKLISQLSDSITKYDQGLSKASQPRPQVSPASQPSPVLNPTPVPSVSPVPSPTPNLELERTRDELERIKKRLEELERQRQLQPQNQQYQNQNSTPTPNPTPTSTPTPKPTPSPTPKGKNMQGATQKVNQDFMQPNQESTQSGTTSSQLVE